MLACKAGMLACERAHVQVPAAAAAGYLPRLCRMLSVYLIACTAPCLQVRQEGGIPPLVTLLHSVDPKVRAQPLPALSRLHAAALLCALGSCMLKLTLSCSLTLPAAAPVHRFRRSSERWRAACARLRSRTRRTRTSLWTWAACRCSYRCCAPTTPPSTTRCAGQGLGRHAVLCCGCMVVVRISCVRAVPDQVTVCAPLISLQAVGVIGNLVHSSATIKKKVLEEGALQPVVNLLSSSCTDSQREAALLLGQFATGGMGALGSRRVVGNGCGLVACAALHYCTARQLTTACRRLSPPQPRATTSTRLCSAARCRR